jgi:hypothetical protein
VTGLLISPITGAVVVALLVLVLLWKGLGEASEQEASGRWVAGSRWILLVLFAAFAANVLARFVLLSG